MAQERDPRLIRRRAAVRSKAPEQSNSWQDFDARRSERPVNVTERCRACGEHYLAGFQQDRVRVVSGRLCPSCRKAKVAARGLGSLPPDPGPKA